MLNYLIGLNHLLCLSFRNDQIRQRNLIIKQISLKFEIEKGKFFFGPTLEERIRPRIFAQNQPIRNRWVQKPRMHMCTSQMNFQKSTFDHQCVGLVSTLYLVLDLVLGYYKNALSFKHFNIDLAIIAKLQLAIKVI